MQVDQFMESNFSGLALRPPLFYHWDVGIRFELGVDYEFDNIYENCPYIRGVYDRAITLFKTVHSPADDLFMVVDVHDYAEGEVFKRKLNTFSKYIKKKSVLYKLQENTIPFVFPEDDEDGEYKTYRFTLKCKAEDIAYIPLLKAICNQDMALQPKIFHYVYFINMTKKTIFHVYDDRGCDLLAASPQTIRGIYESYNEWILDYDREKIDQVFAE
ncbi:MAG: DUF3885 domain-containing protein [Cytobacillus gottheilii]